jgi:hypothetical protein
MIAFAFYPFWHIKLCARELQGASMSVLVPELLGDYFMVIVSDPQI